ncbi:hypothetical protein OG401_40990 [Kitasatospora purpeofusca]|uniref:hypothetical protein n=1 Tax=Kitasatospora purpeofusca TaxID=67352 RepID=UPI0022508E5D|nr:hypothetical protein [Kitasatospora purpeofusca]MCX4690596.1 hypothetical protein [Kitasatospora purpeofusca]
MTRDDLAGMLTDQTPACPPARDALLTGGTFDVWDRLIPAGHHFGVYSFRDRNTRRRGIATLGLTESLGILERAGEEPLRTARITTADGAWVFMLFLDAEATTVLACARGGRVRPEGN